MTNYDLLLTGADVVTPGGVVAADLAVRDGRIAAVLAAGERADADTTIDVTGLTVLPGGIDSHTHLRDPGYTNKEDITSGTRAAAAGGYTTVVGMPNVDPATNTIDRYLEILDLYRQKSIVDFNHNPSPTVPADVPGMVAAGALAFKIFMIADTKRSYPHIPGIGVHDDGQLLEIAEAVAETGRPLMVHGHNQGMMSTIEKRFWARGEHDAQAYARANASYGGVVWDSATALLIRLQEATGVHLHVLHVKTPRMAGLIRAAKQRGQRVTAELNTAAVFLGNDWANIERLGPYALGTWNGEDTTDGLWAALNDGTIDVIGTDHAPHTREEKEIGWSDMWQASGGTPCIQHALPLFLSAVPCGLTSLERVAELTATAPARVFGLYPRKGAIQVGADADLAIVDLDTEDVIRESDVLSKCGWTPYAGRAVTAAVRHTLVRGRFVFRDGEVVGEPGRAQLASPIAT